MLAATTRPLDDDRPLLELLPTDDAVVWLRRGEGFVGWGEAVRIEPGRGPDRLVRGAAALSALLAGAEIEDDVHVRGTGPVGFASATFDERSSGTVLVVPEVLVGRCDGRTWLTRVSATDRAGGVPAPDPLPPAAAPRPTPVRDRVRYAGSSKPDLHWLGAVAEALGHIAAGDIEKVVLARDLAVWSREPLDAVWLAGRLAARFPGCATFLVDGLLGATPEMLVRREGRHVTSLALAGTAARGTTPEEDATLGATLLLSDKDRREHAFAADSVEGRLRGLGARVEREDEPHLLKLDNVQHLATEVRAELASDLTVLEVAAALHPTAAVGGAPTEAALALIRDLEGMERGRYAGPVGWMDARGDGEVGIALRCAEISGARARLFAGVGIVAGSLPESELEETRLKLLAMQRALEA